MASKTRAADPIDSYLAAKQAEVDTLKREFTSLRALFLQLKPTGKPRVSLPDEKKEDSKDHTEQHTAPQDLSTDAGKTAKLLEFIPKPAFAQLKELFITYATLQSYLVADRIELAQYHKFLQECDIFKGGLTRAKADLWFFKKNPGKTVTFWRFVEILAEFAKIHYKCPNGVDRLNDYLQEVVFHAENKRIVQVDISALESQLSQHDVSLILTLRGDVLKSLFKLYRNRDSKSGKGILVAKFLSLLNDFHVVPELLSKPEAVRLFRAAGEKQFAAVLLDFDEFRKCMAMVGLFSFSRPEAGQRQRHSSQECLNALFEWLNFSADFLRVLEMQGQKESPY